ncbi:hypothetical protein ONZ45_g12122 [Pleurotus djamor]|nr:hypothetical protein ONZ45_g12122 [Pleurotus djamor]
MPNLKVPEREYEYSNMDAPQLTLYTNKGSPFGHYVEIALRESNIPYTRYEVDWYAKPPWFKAISPLEKVPAITYGPRTPADQPSTESYKLAESMAMVEFINDIASEGDKLLPGDAMERGRARFYINIVMTTIQPVFLDCMLRKGAPERIVREIEAFQRFLPDVEAAEVEVVGEGARARLSGSGSGNGKFLMGDKFTLADAITAAWFLRIDVFLSHDMGSFPQGEGVKAHTELQTSPKFAKYRAYLGSVMGRESVSETFDKAFHLEKLGSYAVSLR